MISIKYIFLPTLVLLILVVGFVGVSFSQAEGGVLAFPGATGFGRFATGGRQGKLFVVNTLEDTNDPNDQWVSLREAIQLADMPRTILFNVGGVFDLGESELILEGKAGSNLTVACQSAPAPGVVIKSAGITIKGGANNIIMRHCRIRNIDPGSPASNSSRAIGVVGTRNGVSNMIFDHLSLSWATDENFTVYTGEKSTVDSKNFTLSNSIISEGDADSSHSESGKLPGRYVHSMGPSCNSNSATYRIERCSILSNLIAHNARRNPLFVSASGEIQNNIIYNWHEVGSHAWPYKQKVDLFFAGNELKQGPSTRTDQPALDFKNDLDLVAYNSKNNLMFTWRPVSIPDSSQGLSEIDHNVSQQVNLDCLGASMPLRDNIDKRIVTEYIQALGQVGIGSDHRRDYSWYIKGMRAVDYDTDNDGISDEWEIANSLDPNDPSDSQSEIGVNGYTNLERFLHEISVCVPSELTKNRITRNASSIFSHLYRHIFSRP